VLAFNPAVGRVGDVEAVDLDWTYAGVDERGIVLTT
jgi:hypothetical protein